MYTNESSPIKHAMHAWRVVFIILSIVVLCLLAGCGVQSSKLTLTDPQDATKDSLVTPSVTVTTVPIAESTPPATSSGDIISADAALFLLENYDKETSYTFTLVSDHIILHQNHYYSFLASKDSVPVEPLILVDKKTGRFSCLSKNGSLLSFNAFPHVSSAETIDWNGTYTYTDINESLMASLVIDQSNPSSFFFYLKSSIVGKPFNLSGIAHCNGNTADFINEDGEELSFEYDCELGTIRLLDGGISIPEFLNDTGIYHLQDTKKVYQPLLSLEDAKETVAKLTLDQTGLLHEMSEYILSTEKNPLVVHDRLCYCIKTTQKVGSLELSVADFYVSVDGRVIFLYLQSSDQAERIIHYTE